LHGHEEAFRAEQVPGKNLASSASSM
jgi:hypothetical protein